MALSILVDRESPVGRISFENRIEVIDPEDFLRLDVEKLKYHFEELIGSEISEADLELFVDLQKGIVLEYLKLKKQEISTEDYDFKYEQYELGLQELKVQINKNTGFLGFTFGDFSRSIKSRMQNFLDNFAT